MLGSVLDVPRLSTSNSSVLSFFVLSFVFRTIKQIHGFNRRLSPPSGGMGVYLQGKSASENSIIGK